MRITNNIITRNTKTNINSNKVGVDKYNTQMTTQKKISKASEDPVVAIRSLRFSTTLSKLDQYRDNNIPDAQSWLDVTQTALSNMKDLLKDVRTLCVSGSTDTKNADDRQTLLNQLTQLQKQVYEEGNADYGGRTVFGGYRTTSRMTFPSDNDMIYDIEEHFDFKDIKEKRYYSGEVKLPQQVDGDLKTDWNAVDDFYDGVTDVNAGAFHRIRLSYDKVQAQKVASEETADTAGALAPFGMTVTLKEKDPATGAMVAQDPVDITTLGNVTTYATEEDWKKGVNWDNYLDKDKIGANDVIMIRDTGEVIFGDEIYKKLTNAEADMTISYEKKGFEQGDLKPEFYFRCSDVTDKGTVSGGLSLDDVIEYNQVADGTKAERINKQGIEIQTIDYTVSANTTLTINTQADSVFDSNIGRDVDDMIDIVQKAIKAHDKVDQIKKMMNEVRYQDKDDTTHYQENLQMYLDMAQKEADYADDNLQKTYGNYISNFDAYLENVNIALANVGSTIDRLEMTKTRVENQNYTVEQLKTRNEDRDLSDIIIDYYAAYNAYTASLTAAGKIGEQTLLNYL